MNKFSIASYQFNHHSRLKHEFLGKAAVGQALPELPLRAGLDRALAAVGSGGILPESRGKRKVLSATRVRPVAEVGHLERLGRRAPLVGVQRQQPLQQLNEVRTRRYEDVRQRSAGKGLEGDVVGQEVVVGPRVLRRRPKRLEDLAQLVEVGLSGHKRHAKQELREDAAHGPDVDAGPVHPGAEQELRGAVPPRHDKVRVLAVGGAVVLGQTKVRYLDVTLAVDEQVVWFQVAMEDLER